MKCMSCSAEISPEWVFCIQENRCPGCGGPIMTEDSKQLLDELRDAMKRMPNDPEGLSGWLLSNYVLRKVGSAEPINFHRKNNNINNNDPNDVSGDPAFNNFKRRSGADQAPTKKVIDRLLKQTSSMYGEDDGDDVQDSRTDEEIEIEDDAQVAKDLEDPELQAFANKIFSKPARPGLSVNSDLESIFSDVIKENDSAGGFDSVPELNKQRLERLKKQKAFAEGRSTGKFKKANL